MNKEKYAHTVLLHNGEELDDDLAARPNEDLALAALLGVVDGVKRIVEDGSLDHFGDVEILDGYGDQGICEVTWLAFRSPS